MYLSGISIFFCAAALLAGCVQQQFHFTAPVPAPSQSTADYASVYQGQINACSREFSDLRYDLIYLDQDDIPELVVDLPGYRVSVYTCRTGELRTVMDGWAYGVSGNAGYEYIPNENVVRNYNSDLAGAIQYIWYGGMNDAGEMESYYDQSLSSWMFQDTNHNGDWDEWHEWELFVEGEPFDDGRFYYWGSTEITEEEYESYLIQGDYQPIQGVKSDAEILAQLQTIADDSK